MSEAAPPARRFSLGRALLGFLLGLVAGYGGTLLAYIG
jgi:hypothetical protein